MVDGVLRMKEKQMRLYQKYRLNDFREILQELLNNLSGFENFAGKSIIELGPGTKLNLLRFFLKESGAASVLAAGRTISFNNTALHKMVTDIHLLPFLKNQKSKSADIIYSRHVFEQNSFHPILLLRHPAYWRTIKENRFDHPGIDFPSSRENMQAVFKQAWRVLKPGGIIVSQIAKRKSSVLTDSFLKQLRPRAEQISKRKLGRFSEIVTVVK